MTKDRDFNEARGIIAQGYGPAKADSAKLTSHLSLNQQGGIAKRCDSEACIARFTIDSGR
jgi:hypothetical protein